MTHDELVAKIEGQLERWHSKSLIKHVGQAEAVVEVGAWNALLEIAQVHVPDSFDGGGETVTICTECNYEYIWSPDNDDDRWPCDTAKAIEKALT